MEFMLKSGVTKLTAQSSVHVIYSGTEEKASLWNLSFVILIDISYLNLVGDFDAADLKLKSRYIHPGNPDGQDQNHHGWRIQQK